MNHLLLRRTRATLPPEFLLASDKDFLTPRGRLSRGYGAFASPQDRVFLLQAHVLHEACMRLYARDSGKTIGSVSTAIIEYVDQYVDSVSFLDVGRPPEPLWV